MKPYILVLAILAGSLGSAAVAVADDAADVRAAAEEALAAYSAEDVDTIDKYWIPGASIFPGNGQLLEEYNRDFLKGMFEAGLKYTFRWTHLDAKVYGDAAVSTGYFVGEVNLPNGTTISATWRNSAAWIKQGGKWKLANSHSSYLLSEPVKSN